MTNLFDEHLWRPSVEASLDDDKRRVKRFRERVGTEDMLEVIVAGAVVRGVREPRRLRSGLAGEVAVGRRGLKRLVGAGTVTDAAAVCVPSRWV